MDAVPEKPVPASKPMPPMCFACGQMLAGTEVKCPSCGAPLRGRGGATRSGKLTVAAVLFVGIALLNTASVAFLLLEPELNPGSESALGAWTFPVSGTVRYENGSLARNVSVVLDDGNTTQTRTDENGSYQLSRVPIGYHTLRFGEPNETVSEYRVFIGRPETVDGQLSPGSPVVQREDDSYRIGRATFYFYSALFAGLTLLLVGATVACLQRRFYGLALAGAWLSLLDAIPSAGITIIVSVILIVLVMRSKKEFRR